MLAKPESVAADEFKSAKWGEVTACRDFTQADAPAPEVKPKDSR